MPPLTPPGRNFPPLEEIFYPPGRNFPPLEETFFPPLEETFYPPGRNFLPPWKKLFTPLEETFLPPLKNLFFFQEGMIQSQADLIKRLTLQLRSTEDECKASQEEVMTLKQQMSQVSVDLTTSQADLKEVLQALEELALSYDSKDKEIQKSISAKLMLQEEVERLQVGGCGKWMWP